LNNHDDTAFYEGWSPDGSMIFTNGLYDGKVVISDSATGETIQVLTPVGGVLMGSWFPDGSRFITTTMGGQATIWDTSTWEIQMELIPEGYPDWIYGLALSSDGKRIAIWSAEYFHIFDTTTGEKLIEFPGLGGFDLEWSPNDQYLYMIGWDGLGMYDAETGAELMTYDFNCWPMGALSPDGTKMAVAVESGETHIFPVWQSTEDLIAYAKECCSIHTLTAEERELFGLPPVDED
jgi:WD40 repeat protein